MRLKFSIFCLAVFSFSANSQTISEKMSSLGISVPIIWNNSEAVYYQLGSPKYMSGSTINYGINLHYSFSLYKSFYAKIGGGYFRQSFDIRRSFRYTSRYDLMYYTKSYHYQNVQMFSELGYRKMIGKRNAITAGIAYNILYSISQKYVVDNSNDLKETNKRSFVTGDFANISLGLQNMLSKKISIGAELLAPVYTNWHKDEKFVKSYTHDDESDIGKNKFSIGIAVSCFYNF